ncbi:hypothetical protein K1719_014270 [Acacia pycnantha]|nr:hypothetical protein K1719_014270 [Acacia pycnantha]
MHRPNLCSFKTITTLSSVNILPLRKHPWIFFFSSLPHQFQSPIQHKKHRQGFRSSNPNGSNSSIGSPARVQKLIASQTDPLLAKEIFDYASRQPNFRHSYSTYLVLILKLGRARYFSLVDDVLHRLKSSSQLITPTLFSYLIKVYGEADFPDKALKTFYTMMQFDCKPLPKHLNHILEILVSHRNYVRPAFDLFRDAHRGCVGRVKKKKLREAYKLLCRMKVKGCNPDIVHYNTVILGFCREGRAHDACKVIDDMQSNGCLPNLTSYRTLTSGLCNEGMFDEANKYIEEMFAKGLSPHFSVIHALVKGYCNVGKIDEACRVVSKSLEHGELPHMDSWAIIIPRICEVEDNILEEVLKIEIKGSTRIVEAGIGLENYLVRKIRAKSRGH